MHIRSASVIALAVFTMAPCAYAQTIDTFNPLPDSGPKALAIQADGKIIIGGQFQMVGTTPVRSIARLNADGSVDSSFANPAVNSEIKAVAVQADGKILIGGTFDAIGTTARHYLARLNANGTLDAGFLETNLNGTVWSIAVQADGSVLAAGAFTASGTTPRNRVARFTSTGTLDGTFVDPQICNSQANSVALQSNGDIVVGGYFAYIGNCAGSPNYHFYLARYSASGVLDATFPVTEPASAITAIVVGPDDSIYVNGGYSITAGGIRLASKLSANGTLAPSYGNLTNDGAANSFALQPDGKLLIGGDFQTIGTQPRHGLARLNADGSLDTGFNDLHFSFDAMNPNGSVFGLAVQANGGAIAVGNFTFANGQARQNVARVTTADLAVSKLIGQASGNSVVVTWTRIGAGSELAQAPILMHSTDGTNFAAVGPMTRIVNGWQMTAPYNVSGTPFYLQAAAYTSSGAGNGSAGRIASPVYVSDRIFADGFE